MKEASAFVPAHISGFFQFCDASDPERRGSRNCGPCLDVGVVTRVRAQPSRKTSIELFIDGKRAPDARTSLAAAEHVLQGVRLPLEVRIEQTTQVPVGAGYGVSGAGAFGVALALSKALDLTMSRSRAAAIAHVAEVTCGTGLGDVGAQLTGGLVVGLEPGAPPYGKWQRIEVPADVKVVCGTLGPISTRDFMAKGQMLARSEKFGGLAMEKLLRATSIQSFIEASREFAEELGLFDDELRAIAKAAVNAGAIGASQVMLGRAVFALVRPTKLTVVKNAFLELLEPSAVIVAGVDNQGARVI